MNAWERSVLLSRWTHRLGYAFNAPRIYRNWWSVPLPKFGRDVVLELRSGIRYYVRGGTRDLSIVNEAAFADPYLANGFVRIAPDSVVVDIGANIGDFTVRAARAARAGRIIAVEPVESAGAMIATQARLNNLSNITWVHAAIGGSDGETDVTPVRNPYADSGSMRAPLMTLQRLMAEQYLDRIDVLKLDCEGAEWDIFPTSEPVLPRVRQICMEYHCERGWTPQRLGDWLINRGFEVTYTNGQWNGLLWARRTLV